MRTEMRTEAEVEEMIEVMKKKNKGRHITQGVSFNKTCPRQMELLKQALMYSSSFSGLMKELLATMHTNNSPSPPFNDFAQENIPSIPNNKPSKKNVGNFI